MNKKQFLNILKEKLSILNKDEKQDIINEYSDIIDEKIKNGKSVKEAINDFGDIDELTTEILKAYKIDPSYNSFKSKEEMGFFEGIEIAINVIATKMAEITKKTIEKIQNYDNDITIEKVFEIIIKFFILMIIIMILKIPFHILQEIGIGILHFGNNPISQMIKFLWKTFVWAIYFISCFVLLFIFFKTQLDKSTNNNEVKIPKDLEIKKKEKEKQQQNKKESFLKTVVIIFLTVPIVLINIPLYVALSVIIYALIKGISIYGLLMVFLGLIIIFSNLYNMVISIFHNKNKIYLFPYIVGMILIIIGSLFTFEYINKITYYDKLPETNLTIETDIYKDKIKGKLIIQHDNSRTTLKVDNSMKDNEIKIVTKYYDGYVDFSKNIYFNETSNIAYLNFHYKDTSPKYKDLIHVIINNLKDNKIYNYSQIYKLFVEVHGNDNTLKNVKVDW